MAKTQKVSRPQFRTPDPAQRTTRTFNSQGSATAEPTRPSSATLPHLPPSELKNVTCSVCAGTFNLSSTGVFPDHFFNFRAMRKPCSGSGKRYAHLQKSPAPTPSAKKNPKVQKQSNKQVPAPSYPRLSLSKHGKVECPACHRALTPNLKNNSLPVHKNNGESCRMSNRKFDLVSKNNKAAKKVSPAAQSYAEKYKVRSPEQIRKEKQRSQRSAKDRKQEQRKARRRQRRHSDSYALDCYDSWGIDDHSVDQGVSVRTYRGGLPGQGKRR